MLLNLNRALFIVIVFSLARNFACILKLRVSAAMTNAPMILTNVPATPLRALSYYSGPKIRPKYGFVQFPQLFQRINKNDICFFDGLVGPSYLGTGSFFFSPSILWRPIEIWVTGNSWIKPKPCCRQVHTVLGYFSTGTPSIRLQLWEANKLGL